MDNVASESDTKVQEPENGSGSTCMSAFVVVVGVS